MTKEVNQKTIKEHIKNNMQGKNIGIISLSKITKINILSLILLLHLPFTKVRLSKTIKICRALNLQVSEII